MPEFKKKIIEIKEEMDQVYLKYAWLLRHMTVEMRHFH